MNRVVGRLGIVARPRSAARELIGINNNVQSPRRHMLQVFVFIRQRDTPTFTDRNEVFTLTLGLLIILHRPRRVIGCFILASHRPLKLFRLHV